MGNLSKYIFIIFTNRRMSDTLKRGLSVTEDLYCCRNEHKQSSI